MGGDPSRRTMWIAVGLMFFFLALAAFTQASALFILGLVTLLVVLWLKGFVRFPRLRRWTRNFGLGIARLFHKRKPTRTQGITLIIVFSALALLVILNQLRLAAPGQGRGLSVPLEVPSLQFTFGGVSSPGEWIATIISYGLVFGLTALVWWRFWRGVPHDEARWRTFAYWGCLAAFVAMPFVFALLMATAAPEVRPNDEPSQQANVAFSQLWLGVTTFFMAAAFSFAALLPYVGPEPDPIPDVPASVEVAVAPTPAGPAPTFTPAARRK